MGNTIKPHVENARRTGIFTLKNQDISEFPEAILPLTKNLRTLDLSCNKLPSIPPAIGSFQLLKVLNLHRNRLERVPDDIGKLNKLEQLDISENRLTSLPSSLHQLRALRVITLCKNRLREFPLQLCGLKHLDSVDLSDNKITSVPEGIQELEAIEVNLNNNEVSILSESLAQCPRLLVLRIEENCLNLTAFTPTILKNSKISTLAFEGNLFKTKEFNDVDGYEEYQERYTAAKKKIR